MRVLVSIGTHIAPVFHGEIEAGSVCEALRMAQAERFVGVKMEKLTHAAWWFEAAPVGGPVQADVAAHRARVETEAQTKGNAEPWRDEINV